MFEVSKLLFICLCFGWLRYRWFAVAISSHCQLSDFDELFSNDFVFIDVVQRTPLSFKADFKSSINFIFSNPDKQINEANADPSENSAGLFLSLPIH